jgi:chromosome segregation ATPase
MELSGAMDEAHPARVAAAALASTQPPPGDELEALRAELAAAKSRLAATAAEIPTLKSHIESTNGAIVARQEEEGRKQAVVEELRRIADSGRDELRRILLELAAARGAKDALERRVLVRRQALRALQLAERAIAAETHALTWSAAAAAEQLAARGVGGDGDDDEDESAHHDVVAVSARRYEELLQRVEDEERKADARVEEAEALRRAAKARRAAAVGRLEAARGKRREAAQDGRRRDVVHRRGKTVPGKGREVRSQSWRVCLVVKKKLGRFFCNLPKA